jgi:thymidylate synthase
VGTYSVKEESERAVDTMKGHRSTADGYVSILKSLQRSGDKVQIGPEMTHEISPWNGSFAYPRDRLINPVGRKLNYAFCIAEMVDILCCDNPGTAPEYNKNVRNWMVRGKFPGHYGVRMNAMAYDSMMQKPNQLYRCFTELSERPTSRRAVITIHNPMLEAYDSKDVACTMSLQYLIRNDKLHAITTMRSNDALWGFCYDTWLFQFLQEALAGMLGVGLGSYYHHAGSMHYYENRHKQIYDIIKADKPLVAVPIPMTTDSWVDFKDNISMLRTYTRTIKANTSPTEAMVDTACAIFDDKYFRALSICLVADVAHRRKNVDLEKFCLENLPSSSYEYHWVKERCKL